METFYALKKAHQVVLIGDDKQLGPVYKYEIKGCQSMFERLIAAGHPA